MDPLSEGYWFVNGSYPAFFAEEYCDVEFTFLIYRDQWGEEAARVVKPLEIMILYYKMLVKF